MKLVETPENPDDPSSDIIMSFEFDDTPEDQQLYQVLIAGATAKGVPVEQFLLDLLVAKSKEILESKKETKPKRSRKKAVKKNGKVGKKSNPT